MRGITALQQAFVMRAPVWIIQSILLISLTGICRCRRYQARVYEDSEEIDDHNAYTVTEGDILTSSRKDGAYRAWLQGNILDDEAYRWPEGKVAYMLSRKLDDGMKEKIRKAMQNITITTNNCIRFAQRTNEAAYVRIGHPRTGDSGCRAVVGRLGRQQQMQLSSQCQVYDIIHELLHSLGFFHEHTRPDRDKHIQVQWGNIQGDVAQNFVIRNDSTTLGYPYDFNSIMHYPAYETRPLIKSIDPHRKLGVNKALSPWDVKKILRAYKCEDRDTDICTIAAGACTIYNSKLTIDDNRHRIWLNKSAGMTDCHRLSQSAKNQVSVYCYPTAMADDAVSLVRILQHRLDVAHYTVFIFEAALARDHQFNLVKEKVVHLWISTCTTDSTTSKLRRNNFPNLLDFGLHNCSRQRVGISDFEQYGKLRRLVFHATTIALIERNAFEPLIQLQLLQLEEWWQPKYQAIDRQAELVQHAQLLHCSCEYAWLRNWLASMPHLTRGKIPGQIYNGSREITVGEIYISVNCRTAKAVSRTIKIWATYVTGRNSNPSSLPFSSDTPSCV